MRKNKKMLSSILVLMLIRPQVFGSEVTDVRRINNTTPITYNKSSKNTKVQPYAEVKKQQDMLISNSNADARKNTLDARSASSSKEENQNSNTFLLLGMGMLLTAVAAFAAVGTVYYLNQKDKGKDNEKFADDKRLAPYFKQCRLDKADKEVLGYLFDEMKQSKSISKECPDEFIFPLTLYRIFGLSPIFDFVDSDSNGSAKPKQFKVDVVYCPAENGEKKQVTSAFSISDPSADTIDDSFNKTGTHEKYTEIYYSCIKNDLKPDNWEDLCSNVHMSLSSEFCNEKILKLLSLIEHFEFTFEHIGNKKLLKCKIADSNPNIAFSITS